MVELFTETIDHEQGVINTQAKTKTGDEIERENADACEVCEQINKEERAKNRGYANKKWHSRGNKGTENKE